MSERSSFLIDKALQNAKYDYFVALSTPKIFGHGKTKNIIHTNVMSREAAAALMCKLGCLIELLQSNALANVPTALQINRMTIRGRIKKSLL